MRPPQRHPHETLWSTITSENCFQCTFHIIMGPILISILNAIHAYQLCTSHTSLPASFISGHALLAAVTIKHSFSRQKSGTLFSLRVMRSDFSHKKRNGCPAQEKIFSESWQWKLWFLGHFIRHCTKNSIKVGRVDKGQFSTGEIGPCTPQNWILDAVLQTRENLVFYKVHFAFSPICFSTGGILSKSPRVTSLLRLNNRFGQSSGCVVCNCEKANLPVVLRATYSLTTEKIR